MHPWCGRPSELRLFSVERSCPLVRRLMSARLRAVRFVERVPSRGCVQIRPTRSVRNLRERGHDGRRARQDRFDACLQPPGRPVVRPLQRHGGNAYATPCVAMPGNFDEATIQRVNNEGTHTNWFLRWNQTAKATDSMWETRRLLSSITWDLHVSWEGVAFEQENEQYHLIDNAYAYVELKDPSQSLSLDVSGATGHPHFEGHIARLPVWFSIVVNDGSTTVRNEQRGFEIYGDGGRHRLG